MRGALISMKNVKFLVKNPPSKWPKPQNFRAGGAARGALIIENLRFRNLKERLFTSQPKWPRAFIEGGRLLSIPWYVYRSV